MSFLSRFTGLDQWCCDLAGDASFEPSSSRGVLAWMMDSMDSVKTNKQTKKINFNRNRNHLEKETVTPAIWRQSGSYNIQPSPGQVRSHMEPFLRLPALCAGLSLTVLT